MHRETTDTLTEQVDYDVCVKEYSLHLYFSFKYS